VFRTRPFAVGAVAVAAVIVVGCGAVGSPSPEAPSPSAASPAPAGSAAVGRPPGRDHVLVNGGNGRVQISVTLPATGWFGKQGSGFVEGDHGDPPDGAGLIAFNDGEYLVYADPCHWSSSNPSAPATTVDDVMAALANQASRDASAPQDIVVDGHSGKKMVLHVPRHADLGACDQGTFVTFGVPGDDMARSAQGPGQTEEVWAVDVNGRVVLLVAMYFDQAPSAVMDQLRAIVSSTSFG
jgi:hypothetical protein